MKKYITNDKKSLLYNKFTKNYIYKLSQSKNGRMKLNSMEIEFDYVYFCYKIAEKLKNSPNDKLAEKKSGQVALVSRNNYTMKLGDTHFD
jgi:hypothetical protein